MAHHHELPISDMYSRKLRDLACGSRHFYQGTSMNNNTVLTPFQKLKQFSSNFFSVQDNRFNLLMMTNLSQPQQPYPILYSTLASSTDFNSSTDHNITPLIDFNKTTSAFSEETILNHHVHATTPNLGQQSSALCRLISCDGQYTTHVLPQMSVLNSDCLNTLRVAALPRHVPNSLSQKTSHVNKGVVVSGFSEVKLDELMDMGDVGTVFPTKQQMEMERDVDESHNSPYHLKISVLSPDDAKCIFYDQPSDSNPRGELEIGAPLNSSLKVQNSLPNNPGKEVPKVKSLIDEDNTKYSQTKIHSGLAGNKTMEHLLLQQYSSKLTNINNQKQGQYCNWRENPPNNSMMSYNGNQACDLVSLSASQQKGQSNRINVTEQLYTQAESNNSLYSQPALSMPFFESTRQQQALSGYKNEKLCTSTICKDPRYEDLTDDDEDPQMYLATGQHASLSDSNSHKQMAGSTNQDNDQMLTLTEMTSNYREQSWTEKDTLKQSSHCPYSTEPLDGFGTRLCSTYDGGTELAEKIKDSPSYFSSDSIKIHEPNPVLISSPGFCTSSLDTPLTTNQRNNAESEQEDPDTICTDSKYEDITDDDDPQNTLSSSPDNNRNQVLPCRNQDNGDNQTLSVDSMTQTCQCPYYVETSDVFEKSLCPTCETGKKGVKSECITETEASLHENSSGHKEDVQHKELMEYESLPEVTPWIENKTFQSTDETDDDDDDGDWMVLSVAVSDLTFEAIDRHPVSPHNVLLQNTEDEGTPKQVDISCQIGMLPPSSPSSNLDVFESFASFIKAKNVRSVHYISGSDKPQMASFETKSEHHQGPDTRQTKGQSSTSDTENSSDYSVSSPKRNYLTVSAQLWKEKSGDFSKSNSKSAHHACKKISSELWSPLSECESENECSSPTKKGKKRKLQTAAENRSHSPESDSRRKNTNASETTGSCNGPRNKSKCQKISGQNEDMASAESDSEAEQYSDRKWKELRKEQRVKRIADKERQRSRKTIKEGNKGMKQTDKGKQLDKIDVQKQGRNHSEVSKSPPKKRKKDQESKVVKTQQKATLGEHLSTSKDNTPPGHRVANPIESELSLRKGKKEHGFKSFEDQSISRVHPVSSRKSGCESKEDSLSSSELLMKVTKIVSTTRETLTSTRQCPPTSRNESSSSSRKKDSKSRKGTKEVSLTLREIISKVRESSKGMPLSDPREESLSLQELLSKPKKVQFMSISSGKPESEPGEGSSSSKSVFTSTKSPSTTREGLSSSKEDRTKCRNGSTALITVSPPSLAKSREGSAPSKGFPSSSPGCPPISGRRQSTSGEGSVLNSGTVRGINHLNQHVVTEKQSRIPSASESRHGDTKDGHKSGSRQDNAPRRRDSAAPLMKTSLTQAIKATYREVPHECGTHISTSRRDSSMREHLPEPLEDQAPLERSSSSKQIGSKIRSLPFSEVSSTPKETLALLRQCLPKLKEHISSLKETVSKSKEGLSKVGPVATNESIPNPRESSSSVRECWAASRKASTSLKDKEGQPISRRCLASSSKHESDSREPLSPSKSLLKSKEGPYPSRKVLSPSKHFWEKSKEGTLVGPKEGPSSHMSKSREASSPRIGLPSSNQERPSTSGHVPPTSKEDFTWNKGTSRGISKTNPHVVALWKSNSPTTSKNRHQAAEREPRPGPRQDKAPRRRHSSQDSVAPLMKKSLAQAMHLTKATQQESPQKYAQGLKNGYKWAEKKPPCDNRTASERRCIWDVALGHRSK